VRTLKGLINAKGCVKLEEKNSPPFPNLTIDTTFSQIHLAGQSQQSVFNANLLFIISLLLMS
jgi:hypothetical protein